MSDSIVLEDFFQFLFLLVSGIKFVYETERGSTLTLICLNQAHKREREEPVIWYSNHNERVVNSERTQIKYGGKLVLTNIQFEDAGIYTCKNREGDYKHDVRVYVPAENLNCTRGYRRDADRCYPSEVVLKATLSSVSKSTVTRFAWWTALISICLIALCVLCCFYVWKEKTRKERNILKNRVEHKQPGDEKITTNELDILEAMPLIPECEKKVPTKNVKKTKTNIIRKQKVSKRTTLETIYENDLEERNTLRGTPASKQTKTIKEYIQRPLSDRHVKNYDELIIVKPNSKQGHPKENVVILIENSDSQDTFIIGKARKPT
ncbi:uncharacterized protein LOC143227440 [Tachypleus tridentatus]|uniref:uncharacterized protein LOC143227440 n=1 Tax=Tachypleus tridentatus TaxID=6853 RepID=UPI003FD0F190